MQSRDDPFDRTLRNDCNLRLHRLLELADQGPAVRAALAEEVADLLVAWPSDCPAEMRAVFEDLLSRTARDVDTRTRARLRVRLYTDAPLAARLLPRESTLNSVITAARGSKNDLIGRLADTLGLDGACVREILDDESGGALAIACKGAGLGRAAFSTLVLLACQGRHNVGERLGAYDRVAILDAARTLRAWRIEQNAALPQAAE